MPTIPLFSGLWNFLTLPAWPRTALALGETQVTLAALRKRGGEFEPHRLGILRLPPGLVRAHFTEPNLSSEEAFGEQLREVAAQAGLRRVNGLSVALPAGSARSLVFALESLPDDKRERQQVLEWKIERSLGVNYGDLRVNWQRLSDFNGHSQWLVVAVQQRVVEQYERAFKDLGWHAGLLLPQALGEAQWLLRAGLAEDQALVSLRESGFDAVIVRNHEPILVREVTCALEEREDEFYRLLVFYRDRLQPESGPATLSRLLTLGSAPEQRRFREVLVAALENTAVSLDPLQLGLRLETNAPFRELAAATGLATLAWAT